MSTHQLLSHYDQNESNNIARLIDAYDNSSSKEEEDKKHLEVLEQDTGQ